MKSSKSLKIEYYHAKNNHNSHSLIKLVNRLNLKISQLRDEILEILNTKPSNM